MVDYSLKFYRSVFFTLMWEGGYVNDVDDPGGETKFGISKRSFPDLNIRDLSLDEAVSLYHENYWIPVKGELLPVPLGSLVFDFAVNAGVKTSVKELQRVINAGVDGIVGPETLDKVRSVQKVIGRKELCLKYLNSRLNFYNRLVEDSSSRYVKFYRGWFNRVESIKGAFLLRG